MERRSKRERMWSRHPHTDMHGGKTPMHIKSTNNNEEKWKVAAGMMAYDLSS